MSDLQHENMNGRDRYFQGKLNEIDLSEQLKSEAIESEVYVKSNIMSLISREEGVINDQKGDLNHEIRLMHLHSHFHKWNDDLKVTQARRNLYSKTDYELRVANIKHNYDYLVANIDSEKYQDYLDLVLRAEGHEDTIENIMAIEEKRLQAEQYLKDHPAQDFISRVAKERIELKKREKARKQHSKQKQLSSEQTLALKSKEALDKVKKDRLDEFQRLKEKRMKEREEQEQTLAPSPNRTIDKPLFK